MADQFPTGVAVPGGASYQSPQLDFSTFGDLPKTYDEADKAAAARDQRNAFRNGIPKVAGTTLPDYGAMADTLAKARAPIGEVVGLANQGVGWDLYRQLGQKPPGSAPAPGPQSDSGGGDYLSRSKAAESGGNPNATSPTSSSSGLYGFTAGTRAEVAAKHGLNPNDEEGLMTAFTQDNAKALQSYGITPTDRNLRLAHFLGPVGAASFIEGMKGSPNAPAHQLASQDAVRANQSMFFNKDGTPLSAVGFYGKVTGGFGGGTTFAGSETGEPVRTQVAQSGRVDTQPVDVTAPAGAPEVRKPGVPQRVAPMNQPGAQTPASALVPREYVGREQEYADLLDQQARAMAFIPGGIGKIESERLANQSKIIKEAIAKGAELTPEQKNYQSDRRVGETMSGYNARAKGEAALVEGDTKSYQKKYDDLSALGQQARVGMSKVRLGSRLTEDPNFYSGPLEPTVRTYQQFKATFGENPSAALPQEAFQKVVNDLLQEQIKAMGKSGVGRVLQAEVAIMKQAIASLGITPDTNRLLLETVRRTYEKNIEMAQIARRFKGTPGSMSSDLDEALDRYQEQNPLYTPAEINDPRLIAPRHFKNPVEAKAAGLPPGTPVLIEGLPGIRMMK